MRQTLSIVGLVRSYCTFKDQLDKKEIKSRESEINEGASFKFY